MNNVKEFFAGFGVVLLGFLMFGGAYMFATSLKHRINEKRETDSLHIEKIKLEIKLLKLQQGIDE